MLEVSYTTNDPGIAYQTVLILIDEFNKQYQELRFGETNNVIKHFRHELDSIGKELKISEDSLTKYRVEKQVINYDEETKHVAALNRDYELQYWETLNNYNSTDSLKRELEKRMQLYTEIIQNNNSFILLNSKISEINEKLAMAKYYTSDAVSKVTIDSLQCELDKNETALTEAVHKIGYLKYSKEGISNENMIEEWLKQVLAYKKPKAKVNCIPA